MGIYDDDDAHGIGHYSDAHCDDDGDNIDDDDDGDDGEDGDDGDDDGHNDIKLKPQGAGSLPCLLHHHSGLSLFNPNLSKNFILMSLSFIFFCLRYFFLIKKLLTQQNDCSERQ